jgi:hypothetical protein
LPGRNDFGLEPFLLIEFCHPTGWLPYLFRAQEFARPASRSRDAANARVTDEETKYGTMERTEKSSRPIRIDTHVEIFKRESQTSNI